MALHRPKWLQLTDKLNPALFQATHDALRSEGNQTDLHLATVPQLALFHLSGCLYMSARANEEGLHSVAICLVRQCVEAISLVEAGLQESAIRDPLLRRWDLGEITPGELRRSLEASAWPRYGPGLWGEAWGEYFANLAKAVQPYAHYTSGLMGWQMAFRGYDGAQRFMVQVGPTSYDPLKASRVTLLHGLVFWSLGRVAMENRPTDGVRALSHIVEQLGTQLARSKLLFKNRNWGDELAPHVLFKPGHDWLDE